MAKIISFAWTTPAIQAKRKTVTRRDWDDSYAARFKKGDEILAYDKSPRAGGKPIARLVLTHDARYECDFDAPDSDYEGEGFDYLAELFGDGAMSLRHDLSREGFEAWRRECGFSWVIRFEVIEVIGEREREASRA